MPKCQGLSHIFKVWGVQFLGLWYYYPSTEKIRSTQFGAVGYIITLYSSKSYVKSWGSKFWGDPDPPVFAPMQNVLENY